MKSLLSIQIIRLTSIAICLQFAGCQKQTSTTEPAAGELPLVQMSIGSKQYTLEIAADDATREHGLMNRTTMPGDHGMIFAFPNERVLSFWMENTLIPLDIIFADSTGRVVSVNTMQANDLHTTSSIFPAKYAIELNSAADKDNGVKPGDVLTVPPAVDQKFKK